MMKTNRTAVHKGSSLILEDDTHVPPLNALSKSGMMVAQHIVKGTKANNRGKVAWLTSGAPVELLRAFDFYTFYPENHGAICGTARQTETISIEAEKQGYSRDLCSYARTDIGSMLSGKTPLKAIPKPDILVACTNICQTVIHWYRVLAHRFQVPLVLIDTPFIYKDVTEHSVAYVTRQIEAAVPQIEEVAGKALDYQRFQEITRLSQEASQLWMEILATCQNKPAPISAFDQFILMAPIVEMRGEAKTVDLYAETLEEVNGRVKDGLGAIKEERVRLLWDNLPIWYELGYLAEFLERRGVVLAASTYTSAWGTLAELYDPDRPFESAAQTYLHPLLNRSPAYKLMVMLQMVSDFHLDGVIMHSDRSCKPYSIGQMDQRDRLINAHGIPSLLLEADHGDPRSFSEQQVANRLEAFCEVLGV